MNQHGFAIEDCRRAIEIDPNYSKAYGRMGLAYSNMNNHYQAKDSFKKALDLDPSNESYASNLKVAEDSIRDMEARNPLANFFNNPAIANVAEQLLQDPNLQNFVGGLMSSALGNIGGPPSGASPSSSESAPGMGMPPGMSPSGPSGSPGAPGGPAGPGGIPFGFPFGMPPSGAPGATSPGANEAMGGGSLDAILRVGQQLASQVEAANPELIEQLRRRFSANVNPGDNNNSNQNNDSRS